MKTFFVENSIGSTANTINHKAAGEPNSGKPCGAE